MPAGTMFRLSGVRLGAWVCCLVATGAGAQPPDIDAPPPEDDIRGRQLEVLSTLDLEPAPQVQSGGYAVTLKQAARVRVTTPGRPATLSVLLTFLVDSETDPLEEPSKYLMALNSGVGFRRRPLLALGHNPLLEEALEIEPPARGIELRALVAAGALSRTGPLVGNLRAPEGEPGKLEAELPYRSGAEPVRQPLPLAAQLLSVRRNELTEDFAVPLIEAHLAVMTTEPEQTEGWQTGFRGLDWLLRALHLTGRGWSLKTATAVSGGIRFQMWPHGTATWTPKEAGAKGRPGYLGVRYRAEDTMVDGAPRRLAKLTNVQPGTPAQRAGWRQEDFLLSVDGKPLDPNRVPVVFGALPAGKPVDVEVLRDGKRVTLPIAPGLGTPVERRGFDYFQVKAAWERLTTVLDAGGNDQRAMTLHRLGADPQNPDFAPDTLAVQFERQSYKLVPVDFGQLSLPAELFAPLE